MTLDDALHVNDATCYLNYCKSPLRYCLNTATLIMLHVGGYNVSGKAHTSLSILMFNTQLVLFSFLKSIIVKEKWN